MLHVVHQLERRFPAHGPRILACLLLVSASVLALGIGQFLL